MHWLEKCAGTWRKTDGRQKIHYSQQLAGGKPGMHSLTIDAGAFAAFYRDIADRDVDVMLEVKDKNLSAVKCLDCVGENTPRDALTRSWARYKYAVLEHSQAHYARICQHLKARAPDAVGYYALVDDALATPVASGQAINAAEQVWGYFSRDASAAEKKRFASAREKLAADPAALPAMKRLLLRLAEQRRQPYLLDSLYFDL